jgi:hypothetical protein
MISLVAWPPERILMQQMLPLILEATVIQAFLRRMCHIRKVVVYLNATFRLNTPAGPHCNVFAALTNTGNREGSN